MKKKCFVSLLIMLKYVFHVCLLCGKGGGGGGIYPQFNMAT